MTFAAAARLICALIFALMFALPDHVDARGLTVADVVSMVGGEPWRDGLADVPVRFEADAPYVGALGLACDPAFRGVPGNAQSWCGDFEGIVVYTPHVTDLTTLLNILRHEDYHLSHPYVGPPEEDDLFDEAGAYRAGCAYQPHDFCPAWLADHPEVRP